MKPPKCGICGKPKYRGTLAIGKDVRDFWMCGTLQFDHDEILAHKEDEDDEDVDWEDEAAPGDPGAEDSEDALWDDL